MKLAPTSSFADHVKIETHNGAPLAALPLLTVRRDPTAGVWDLYVFQRLVAEDIPLADTKGARQFTLQPGVQGAWLLNLTMSDENPLFVDANANAIDDAFEKQKRNDTLLAATAPRRAQDTRDRMEVRPNRRQSGPLENPPARARRSPRCCDAEVRRARPPRHGSEP